MEELSNKEGMAENPTPPGGEQPKQINLQQVAQQFMAGLQRHFDMLAFNLASREGAQEGAYIRHANARSVMPSAPNHLNFEQMQAYARDLMVRQLLNDTLNLAATALNNAHFFLAVIKAKAQSAEISPEAQKAAQEAQHRFVQAAFDEKFNRLEKDYGVLCPLEDTIISLGMALQALVQQGGIVREPQVDENGELAFDLKTVELSESTETTPQGRIIEQRKTFREGEAITLNDGELQSLLITIAAFADHLFRAVSKFGQEQGNT
ncbi:MAG: hypothetical protein EA353_00780 [Puniceicoccaceae bacterium]|nr:MAG: hypothetical protein EA353_00780 [Puniceicoccaceae bacterium]